MLLSVWVVLWTALLGPLVYVLYIVTCWTWKAHCQKLILYKFPSEPRHWLWGHLHLFPGPTEAGLEKLRYWVKIFPRCFMYDMVVIHKLVVQHPDTISVIVKSTEPKPRSMGVYAFGVSWLGDGLLLSSGKKWARNRKLLTPAFHFDILRPYMAINNKAADILLGKLEKAADSGQSMEIFSHIALLTLDIILRCAFSYENDCQLRGDGHPYVQAVGEMGDLWVARTMKPWLYPDFMYNLTADGRTFRRHCNFVHSVSEEVIAKRKETLREAGKAALNPGRYLDFLDILLTAKDDTGAGLSDAEIRAEVDTFMFAGHDTTASSMSWLLYSLASNPACQERVQEEVDSILDGRDTDAVLWADLPRLRYLTLALKESMRLHCPVPFIERQTTQPFQIDGKTVPVGMIVAIQIYNLHHNPVVWDEPMEFRPERFLPENIAKMDPFAFIPFSAGPRNCIGQNFSMHEQKSVLAQVLHRFTFALDPARPVEKKLGVVMKTKAGMWLRVTRRSD